MRGLLVGLLAPLLIGSGFIVPNPPPEAVEKSLLPIAVAAAPAVAGIPEPCFAPHPFPDDKSGEDLRYWMGATFGLKLTGDGWADRRYRPIVKILWEAFDGTSCSPYLSTIRAKNGGTVELYAGRINSWAWGDYGLSRPNAVSLDFAKLITAHEAGDDGRIVRLVMHELMHVYQKDRGSNPSYMSSFSQLRRTEGSFSDYGNNDLEVMAEVVGYYVARCADDNPYDSGEHDAYYEWAKKVVFEDVEFGPAPGTKPTC